MRIRDELPSDVPAIRRVVETAFGQSDEADLVDALRTSGDAVISLVAEDCGEIIGQVLFSRLQAPDRSLALAPVSVTPRRQNQRIGTLLIEAGLRRATQDGWRTVFVLGEPGYYERFGFSLAAAAKFETIFPKAYFMALELEPGTLAEQNGPVVYAAPFLAFT